MITFRGHTARELLVYCWSERVLDIIALVNRGFGSVVEAIRGDAA